MYNLGFQYIALHPRNWTILGSCNKNPYARILEMLSWNGAVWHWQYLDYCVLGTANMYSSFIQAILSVFFGKQLNGGLAFFNAFSNWLFAVYQQIFFLSTHLVGIIYLCFFSVLQVFRHVKYYETVSSFGFLSAFFLLQLLKQYLPSAYYDKLHKVLMRTASTTIWTLRELVVAETFLFVGNDTHIPWSIVSRKLIFLRNEPVAVLRKLGLITTQFCEEL